MPPLDPGEGTMFTNVTVRGGRTRCAALLRIWPGDSSIDAVVPNSVSHARVRFEILTDSLAKAVLRRCDATSVRIDARGITCLCMLHGDVASSGERNAWRGDLSRKADVCASGIPIPTGWLLVIGVVLLARPAKPAEIRGEIDRADRAGW